MNIDQIKTQVVLLKKDHLSKIKGGNDSDMTTNLIINEDIDGF